MADLTANRSPNRLGPSEVCLIAEPVGPLGVNTPEPNGSTGITIYAGALVGYNTAGRIDNIDTSGIAIVTVAGVNLKYHSSVAGAPAGATLTNLRIGKGAYSFLCDATVSGTLAYGTDLYAVDTQTLSADPGSNRIRAGFFEGMDPSNTANCICQVGQASPLATAPAAGSTGAKPYFARAVFTSTTMASYTGTGTGVLTAGTNAALAAQDGVTLAVGDVVLLQGGTLGSLAITAADTGPYVVTSLGGASAKWVLTRPSWWQHAAIIPTAQSIQIGPEGTLFPNTTWTSWAAPASVVDTADPLFYPDRVILSAALVASTYSLITVPIRSATKSSVEATFVAAGGTTTSTIGYGIIAAPTPGYIGTASAVIDALASGMGKNGSADTSTVCIVVINR
jgi:hypothetical protein